MNVKFLLSADNKENISSRSYYNPFKLKSSVKVLQFGENKNLSIDIDLQDSENPKYLGCYAKEIFRNLKRIETSCTPQYGYIKQQFQITEKMRAILIDWIIDVHNKFQLKPETLFLTVNLIDRYLERSQIAKENLQLVGVTGLFIACKYEEIYAPYAKDMEKVTSNAYTKSQIIDMERNMLKVLEYNITVTSSYEFLERFARIVMMESRAHSLARYFIELCLLDCKMIKFSSSTMAGSAVYLSHKMLKFMPAWDHRLEEESQLTENDLRNCAREMCGLIQGIKKTGLEAIIRKYSLPKYHEVANIEMLMVR
ncbi:unnamed protein product [Blepharisma stoltei]|uniref:Cyclin N-terminal domain-containing protein n=1 Tax=Blepharisma stoltei TaxID=1481888 RepID=A0AAU9IU11_9CILI|nr:unnamed protein product [Blepharisma stoltei]